MEYNLRFRQYSERAILIEWPQKIDQKMLQNILFCKKSIEEHRNEVIVEVISSYNSLLIFYLSTIENVYDEVLVLKSLCSISFEPSDQKQRLWKIPVCYDPALAPDLLSFSEQKKLSIDDVIDLHTTPLYQVYFLGFLPGFFYLGGLDKKLCLPRKVTPSRNVKKGSVAIGGEQTGIYPKDSPGGWHVIGACPVDFFDVNKVESSKILPDDLIQFISISVLQYADMSANKVSPSFELKPTFL
ncbi:5-oxoprolinase subunit PxpB [Aquimarina spongiae]|uniref:Inhibitor of KinA n=1 Tax=Aquimarina spongiae TaxID=570521 RepID=A0A1M6GAB6_9FLAO|nr:5-oxoprolinase subunit PxpB [Aquimarina spongiae]SHJ06868.1 inhibitor of KinA [Aquimarina spongiae]